MSPFGGAFGLPHANPVGGFVAGSPEAIFFHEGFQEIDGLLVDRRPIRRDSSGNHGQNLGGQTLDVDPGQNKKASIIDHKREVLLLGELVPADEGFSGLNRPGGGSPADTGHRTIPQKGHILQMLPDDLAVTEVMILVDEAIVEGFKSGMSYQRDIDGRKISKFSGDGAVIDRKHRSAFVSPFIPTIGFSRWEDKMSHTFQGEEHFPAGHVFGGAVGLDPSPLVAQDIGDAFSSFGPVFIDHPLNHGDVGFRNGSSAYGGG